MTSKKLRIFAGPNGSGKSTLVEEIRTNFNIGFFINADKIEASLNTRKHLDCSDFSASPLFHSDWQTFLRDYVFDERFSPDSFAEIAIKENFFTCKRKINSYQASAIAEFFRERLLLGNLTFSFETVMSHISKVKFLKKAKQQGFNTYLYFVCTQDPKINVQRVKNRVVTGGHYVLEEKTISRYFRSLELLSDAFLAVDRAFIIDSSYKNQDVVLEKRYDEVFIHQDAVPTWVVEYLLDRIKLT